MTATLTLTPNYHTIGVKLTWDLSDDPDRSIQYPALEYKESTSGTWLDGWRLQRLTGENEAHSAIFNLDADTEYDVRVTISDTGDALDGDILTATESTRANPVLNASPVRTVNVANTTQLAAAIADATAGDDIVLAGGTYYTGNLSSSASGTSANPITIRAATGETVTLDGRDTASLSWSLTGTFSGEEMYQATVSGYDNCRNVTWDDRILSPARTLTDCKNFTAYGTYSTFYQDGTTLYVHLTTGANPAGEDIKIAKYNHAFSISGDFWHVRDIYFQNYGEDILFSALILTSAKDCVIDMCTFFNCVGILAQGACDRLTIQNCTATHDMSIVVREQLKALPAGLGSHIGTGFRWRSAPGPQQTVVRWNKLQDLMDGMQINFGAPSDNAPTDCDVYENLLDEFMDDGIECDFYAKNVRIFRNRISGAHAQISLAKPYPGPVFIYDNTVYNIGNDVPSLQSNHSRFIKWNTNKETVIAPTFIFHNTVVGIRDHTGSGPCIIMRADPVDEFAGVDMRNNIFWGKDYDVRIDTAGFYLDYNCYRPSFYSRWLGTYYTSLSAFQAVGGDQGNGISTDPQFVDMPNYDFTLGGSSPCVAAAVELANFNSELSAGDRDIGALTTMASVPDSGGEGTPPPPVPPPPPVGGGGGGNVNSWEQAASASHYIDVTGSAIGTGASGVVDFAYNSTYTWIQFFNWDGTYSAGAERSLMAAENVYASGHSFEIMMFLEDQAEPTYINMFGRSGSVDSDAVIDADTWYCAAFVNDGGDDGAALTLYLYEWDGVDTWTQVDANTGDEGGTAPNMNRLWIGARPLSSTSITEPFSGELGPIAYLTTDLSAAQIEAMLSEGPGSYLEDNENLVFYFDWNGATSQSNTAGTSTVTATVYGGSWTFNADAILWPSGDDGEIKAFDLGLNSGLRMNRSI